MTRREVHQCSIWLVGGWLCWHVASRNASGDRLASRLNLHICIEYAFCTLALNRFLLALPGCHRAPGRRVAQRVSFLHRVAALLYIIGPFQGISEIMARKPIERDRAKLHFVPLSISLCALSSLNVPQYEVVPKCGRTVIISDEASESFTKTSITGV